MAVKAIPDGYHTATPYLIVNGAGQAIEFYEKAFGATRSVRLEGPGGKLAHAEVRIGDSIIMLADEFPEMGCLSPHALGGSPAGIFLYVEDVDATFAQAIAAGATIKRPIADQFYGDRSGTLLDPFGHQWTIATHKEDLSLEQITQHYAAMIAEKPRQSPKEM